MSVAKGGTSGGVAARQKDQRGLSTEEYLRQLETKYGDRRKAEFASESPTVVKYFESVSAALESQYTIDKVLAVGGTGIVHTGRHNRFHQPIVIKINRPNVEAEAVSMVANEASILPTLSHPNIVAVLDLGEITDVTPKLTYIVEPFIAGSKPFFAFDEDRKKETWLYGKLQQLRALIPAAPQLQHIDDPGRTIGLITSLLTDVASLLSQWVSLLSHVHSKHDLAEHGYVYLDVKSENVLIDDHLHLTSIDYGSVEHLDLQDASPIEVFFTERYAHPDLIRRKKEKASSNRVRGGIKRHDLVPAFDYFALGISILEILNEIALIRPHVVPQLPLYRSLHFLATRLLDGRNSSRPIDDYAYASQVFPNLRDSDYANLGYTNLDDVHRDLEKERGRWNVEHQVPELATYSKDIVRVVPGFNTVLTPRLRGVIEHPLVARLKYVTQLGLVSLVYPTADHSRYDHALGSYTYTTYYVKSLFNDLGNPIFRNLVGTEDLNAVLLAALLHDVGQYPLAHDLEEVQEGIFNHGRIGMELLEDGTRDQLGRTLQQIIEDPQNGWGVSAENLRRILGAHSKNLPLAEQPQRASLKTNVLAAIVDGQVDADKADYIVRDSVRCELPYGAQLDLERLLRVLTVAILPEEPVPERRVALGVYDKGLVSAHAFGQARYQLLSTVYWHHTVRIAKSMLQYAAAWGLPLDVFGPDRALRERKELEIRQQLIAFVKSLVPPFHLPRGETHGGAQPDAGFDLTAEPPEQVIDTVGRAKVRKAKLRKSTDAGFGEETRWYPGVSWTDWLMLQWITDLPNASVQSRNLIRGIQNRKLYKRVATFSRAGGYETLIGKLDELTWPERVDLCKRFHEQVRELISRTWANLTTVTPMDETDFDKLCASHLLMLIDVPSPSKKVGYDRPLGVVPELKEKSYHEETRQAAEDKDWREIMDKMTEGIAPVRVLCHPDIRNIVSAAYEKTGHRHVSVEQKIAQALASLLGLKTP